MSRSAKKFLYGIFYLAVLAALLSPVFRTAVRSTESCADGAQNQNETGVDCGGSCVPCVITQLEPLRLEGPVEILHLVSGRVALLGEISNPNQDYGASSFSYNFNIYDQSNRLAQTITGNESIYGSEKKYIFEADIKNSYDNISKVELSLSNNAWVPLRDALRPILGVSQKAVTEVTSDTVRVSGVINNQSSLKTDAVKVIAILFDRFGDILFASQTITNAVGGFEEKPFVVSFPFDAELAKRTDPAATKIFFSSR
jgi:hypothetical protein